MKALYKGLSILAGIGLMVALLISAVEYISYGKDGYYETQYAKYEVLDQVHMEMDELLYVTDEMMDYLRGDRSDLVVVAEIDGVEREFFNDKEKRHMVDVQGLFLGGQTLRLGCVIFVLLVGGFLLYRKKGRLFFGGIQWGIAGVLGAIGLLSILMATNFNKYFTMFHLIFFDNDDWILNPATDLLINIVPEGFFRDTAFWIAGIFLAGALLLWFLAGFCRKKIKTGE